MRTVPDASFDEFFRLRYRDLVRYVGRLGATLHDAEKAAQDAMMAAYERWQRIDNPDACVWRVACRSYLRTPSTQAVARGAPAG